MRRHLSPSLRAKIYRSNGNILKDSMKYNFPIQSTPPLSFQQYARSVTILPGVQQWQHPGLYHPPTIHSYLSPERRAKLNLPEVQPWIYSYRRKYSIPTYSLKNYKDFKPKPTEPIWHPPGPYRSKCPTSLSPEKKWQQRIHEPLWQPTGSIQYKSVPYFDPPNLRWSLQQLLKSMPNLRPKPSKVTPLTKSQYVKDSLN